MKLAPWLVVLAACSSKSSPPGAGSGSATTSTATASPGSAVGGSAVRPPDDMDERMRHCPLAIDGATATLTETAEGVRWEIQAGSQASIDEVRRRAHHAVEFAAGRTAKGQHGGGQGGGTMRNCPVVTSGVVIVATDSAQGARLDVSPVQPADLGSLRTDSHERASTFPFTGATLIDANK